MKFLLPSEVPQFDFQFELLRANDFFKWKNGHGFEIAYGNADQSYCPVGSVEFCYEHGITCAPRNIPCELEKHAYGGEVFCKRSQLVQGSSYHVKSALKLKDDRNDTITFNAAEDNIPFEDNTFQAVKWLKEGFVAEWRCFVMDGKLLDIKQYVARDDEALFVVPSRSAILEMISEFKHAPCTYILDVGVASDGKTYIIEVHDFFACGLYKFDDQYRLPSMLWNWYRDYRMTKEKEEVK